MPTRCAAVTTEPVSASASIKARCLAGDQPSLRGFLRTGTQS